MRVQLWLAVALLSVASTRVYAEETAEENTSKYLEERLFAGSLAGAALDETAPAEVIRPSTRSAFQASIRKLGGVLASGKSSAAVQINPYLLNSGGPGFYDDVVAARKKNYLLQLFQDSAITTVITEGAPANVAGADDAGRFMTLGLGVSAELLGGRSVYSSGFSECMKTSDKDFDNRVLALQSEPAVPAITYPPVPTRQAGQSDADFLTALASHQAAVQQVELQYKKDVEEYPKKMKDREKGIQDIKEQVSKQLTSCRENAISRNGALFVSLGARWLMPGAQRQPGDAFFIQREYLAATYEFRVSGPIAISLQGRLLGDRNSPASFAYLGDAGLSLSYNGDIVRWSLDATETILKPESAAGVSTISGVMRVRLAGDLFLALGLRGKGQDLSDAVNKSALTLAISYENNPILTRPFKPGT